MLILYFQLRSAISDSRNKIRKSKLAHEANKLNRQVKTGKHRGRQAAEARGEKVERKAPKTIENQRRADDTIGNQ